MTAQQHARRAIAAGWTSTETPSAPHPPRAPTRAPTSSPASAPTNRCSGSPSRPRPAPTGTDDLDGADTLAARTGHLTLGSCGSCGVQVVTAQMRGGLGERPERSAGPASPVAGMTGSGNRERDRAGQVLRLGVGVSRPGPLLPPLRRLRGRLRRHRALGHPPAGRDLPGSSGAGADPDQERHLAASPGLSSGVKQVQPSSRDWGAVALSARRAYRSSITSICDKEGIR